MLFSPSLTDDQRASALRNLGFYDQVRGDLDHAIANYTAAINMGAGAMGGPATLAKTYANRGQAFANRGDDDHAYADYTMTLKLDPKLSSALLNRAALSAERGHNDEAFTDLNLAASLDPKDGASLVSRGDALRQGRRHW